MEQFEARSLRIQIPCGPVTMIQCGGNTICRFVTGYCGYPTQWGCGILGSNWCRIFTCEWGSGDPCGWASPVVLGTPELLCAGTEELQPKVTIDVEHLPALREQLETQLKEIQAAEEQVKKQGK